MLGARLLLALAFLGIGGWLAFGDADIFKSDQSEVYAPQVARSCDRFTIYINNTPYTQPAALRPAHPIMAEFCHPGAAFSQVMMQHPADPNRRQQFHAAGAHRIRNHEQHMRMGHESSSEFVAMDSLENVLGRITLTFHPNAEE